MSNKRDGRSRVFLVSSEAMVMNVIRLVEDVRPSFDKGRPWDEK